MPSSRFHPQPPSGLRHIVGGGALLATPGLFAEMLTLTPTQTPGPFYPDRIPLDKDNDLLILNDGLTPAVGTVTHVSGRVLDRMGSPLRGAWSNSGRQTTTAPTCTAPAR